MARFETFSTQRCPDGEPATARSFTVLWQDTMVSRRKKECVRRLVHGMYALSASRRLKNTFELCMSYSGPISTCQSQNQLTLLAVGLSGLFVLSDWIGSAERWFEYTAPIAADGTFELYWRRAQAAAKVAVDQARVSSRHVREFKGFQNSFRRGVHLVRSSRSPRPHHCRTDLRLSSSRTSRVQARRKPQ